MGKVMLWQHAAVVAAAWLLVCSAVATGQFVPGLDPCDLFAPCGPDGGCKTTNESPFYTCECFPGLKWNAKTVKCEELDLCNPNPCGPGGTCSTDGEGTYECSCEDKYVKGLKQGKATCIAESNACEKNPCGPAGECTPMDDKTYACDCFPGYAQIQGTGFCREIADPCVDNPCTGVGNKCVPLLGGGYRCECGPEYFLPPRFRQAGGYCVLRKYLRLRKSRRRGMKPRKGRGKYWKSKYESDKKEVEMVPKGEPVQLPQEVLPWH